MCGKTCHSTCMRSVDNFVEFSPFSLMWVLRNEPRSPSLHSKYLYLLSHIMGPYLPFFFLLCFLKLINF